MSRRTLPLTERLYEYLLAHSLREHPAHERLRAETARLPEAGMQIAPEQGQLMALLVELSGARRVLEIGCFTGYGTLAMALALPPDGRLLTLDVNPDWVALGQRAWREAGVAAKIEVRFGLALESLDQLIADGAAGSFDLIFDRRRQEELRRLLRAQPDAGAAGRPDPDRQRAVGRPGRRPRQYAIARPRSCARSTPSCTTTSASASRWCRSATA